MAEKPDYKKNNAVHFIKRNVKLIGSIVLLAVFSLLFINLRVLFRDYDFFSPLSVATLILFISCLVALSYLVAKIISLEAIREIEEHMEKLNNLLIITKQEIAERKTAQERLKYAHNELEDQVQERTKELMEAMAKLQEELVNAKKRASN